MVELGSASNLKQTRLAIIGAGVIGLSCALELVKRGVRVTIFDRGQPGQGASWAAAGMLSPAFEAANEPSAHPKLFDLCLQSAELWPAYATYIESQSGRAVGYRPGPSLAVSTTDKEARQLNKIEFALSKRGIPCDRLGRAHLQDIEPALGGDIADALRLPTDGHVDNRSLLAAMIQMCWAHKDIQLRTETEIMKPDTLLDEFDAVLCTAGWRSVNLLTAASEVSSVAGQLFSIAQFNGAPKHTIRCGSLYIAPKEDRVVVGATVEPGVVRDTADLKAIDALHAKAAEICPGLATAARLEVWAGVRPGSPDHAPLLGKADDASIYFATGHYRNGVLLAPVTAKLMAEMICDGKTPELAQAFSAKRFEPSLT